MTTDSEKTREILSAFLETCPLQMADDVGRGLRRQRVVARMEGILLEQGGVRRGPWRRPWLPVGAALALAAGVALTVLGFFRASPNQVAADHGGAWDGSASPLWCRSSDRGEWAGCNATSIPAGHWLRTTQRSAELRTPAQVRVSLSPRTRLRWGHAEHPDQIEQILLMQGRISVQVPHLGDGQAFQVEALDVTVVVKGTAFSVEVLERDGGARSSCVRVTEGVVVVQHGSLQEPIAAPGAVGCEPLGPIPGGAPASGSAAPIPDGSKDQRGSTPGQAPETSTLAAETRRLERALEAERIGDYRTAQTLLQALLARYPNSVVAPEARAALARLREQQKRRLD